MLELLFDEQFFLIDARCMLFSRNKKRIIIKDDILYRQYYIDIGEVSHLQVLLLGKLLNVFLQSLPANAQVFERCCKKSVRSITSLELQRISETGLVIAKYAFKINA